MRIAELSRQSGIPVPTIKYYLREGLLQQGELTSPNQASYDDGHLRRLQFVRALLEVGRLPIAAIKEIIAELDRPSPDVHTAMGRAVKAIGDYEPEPESTREVDELIARHGWEVGKTAPARQAVADVIVTLRRLGAGDFVDRIDEYAALAGRLGEIDLEVVGRQRNPQDIVYSAVVGAIVGDVLMSNLRRLAQESASAKRFSPSPPPG